MKIVDVRTWALRSDLAEPFAFSQGWVAQRAATIVEVVTDEGVSGWGEALCQGLQPPEIAAAAISSAFRPLLIGEDPARPEVLWHRMYNRSRDYGLKGAVIGAISAIDIACGTSSGNRWGVRSTRFSAVRSARGCSLTRPGSTGSAVAAKANDLPPKRSGTTRTVFAR